MVVREHGHDIIHGHELGQKRWIVNGPAHESHVKLLPLKTSQQLGKVRLDERDLNVGALFRKETKLQAI
jgi:hypothetical protein